MLSNQKFVRALGSGLVSAALLVAQSGGQASNTKSVVSAADQREIDAAGQHVTQKLRAALMADKSLSTDARNVKITSQGGRIILKGRVRSDEEAQKIVAKAIEIKGSDGDIDNQLSVKLVSTK